MKEERFRKKRFVMNLVLDGIGIAKNKFGDAFYEAKTPTLDYLKENSLYQEIYAHGTHVGLPSDADMGNSEVGHNTLGTGNINPQGAKLVNLAIDKGTILENDNWKKGLAQLKKNSSRLHFIGLLSDGNVHSHINHLKYLIEKAAQEGIKEIYLHALLDGRDTDPHSSLIYLKDLGEFFEDIKSRFSITPKIASFGGRMVIVMDRYEADWQMVERGWQVIVEGQGDKCQDALEQVELIKKDNPDLSDQYLPPFVICDKENRPLGEVNDGDVVILFNFRGDRAMEMCQAFEKEALPQIKKRKHPKVFFMSLLEYDADKKIPQNYLVSPIAIANSMGKFLTQNQARLFALSETQKYGHVTYFWNGNRFNKFDEGLEDYFEIPSDNCPFDERPWMKSAEITDKTIQLIKSKKYDYGRINFPNGDMVGHTGNFDAARISVEAVDLCLKRILHALKEVDGIAVILADHGNCEEMYQIDGKTNQVKKDKSGRPLKKNSHTTNLVPLFIYDPLYNEEYDWAELDKPGLSNIAATTIELMGFEAPAYFRPSLLKWKRDGR